MSAADGDVGDRSRRWSRWPWWLVVLPAAVGVVVVGVAYRLSATGLPAGLYYLTFWIGVLSALLPVAVKLTRSHLGRGQRALALLLLGVLTAVPKYLRNPTQPLYHDEYAHWREAVEVLSSQHLLPPNTLIPIVQFFPGTSGLTFMVNRLTGLSLWHSGELIVAVVHLATLFAVFLIAEVHLSSARAGAVAALVYAVNPSALYFDTQYAYESVAIGLFCWVLALASLATRATTRRGRIGLTIASILCAAGCVVTHHLTTVFLLTVLFILAGGTQVARVRARRTDRARPARGRYAEPDDPSTETGSLLRAEHWIWPIVFAATLLIAAGWLFGVAQATITYLSPYVGGSLQQLLTIGRERGQSGRIVLAATVQPFWERFLTGLAPIVIGLTCLVGVVRVWQSRQQWPAAALSLMVFGLIYFPSVPFILAPSGAEGARRSWGFTYLGISLIVALALLGHERFSSDQVELARARQLAHHAAQATDPAPPGRWRFIRRLADVLQWRVVALVALVVVLIGNVGGGLNDPYRFPGPFRWGTDTNSVSQEARTVARRLSAQSGHVRVVTDAYTALQLAAYGGMEVAAPSDGFPAWNLTQTDQDPSTSLTRMLYESHYQYLVVDDRIAEEPAFNGANYGPNDPLLGQATPQANLDRLTTVPWAHLVMSTQHLRVYRLDLLQLGVRIKGRS